MFEPAARAALFTFVSGRPPAGAGGSVQQQRLHSFKCSQRVANYGQLRAGLVLIEQEPSCNETVAACDYLEQQHMKTDRVRSEARIHLCTRQPWTRTPRVP